jgi:transcriptional regulator with XRE-family HTH domain
MQQNMAIRIRRSRVAAKFSQRQLAVRLGVQRSAVAQWESPAGTLPNMEHLTMIAVATGVSFEWLATGRGQSSSEHVESAALLDDFAQSEIESRLLCLLRRLSPKRQHMAFELLEVLLK